MRRLSHLREDLSIFGTGINEKGEAEIDVSKCKGCGACVAECPAKAIDLMHYRDAQLIEKTKTLCVGTHSIEHSA